MRTIVFLLVLAFILPFAVLAQASPSLYITTPTTSVSVGQEIPVQVGLLSGENSIASADIWLQYNPRIVELVKQDGGIKVDSTDVFAQIGAKETGGKLYIFGLYQDQKDVKENTIATVYFRPTQEGIANIKLLCDGDQYSQLILDDNSLTNAIDCIRTVSHSLQLNISGDASSVLGISDSRSAPMMWFSFAGILTVTTATILLLRKIHLSDL